MSSISSADEDQESVGDDAEQMSTYYKSSMGVAPPSGWQDSQMDPGKEEGSGIKWVESGVKWEETWVKWVEPGVLMELRCMSLKIFVERTMLEHAHQVRCRTGSMFITHVKTLKVRIMVYEANFSILN